MLYTVTEILSPTYNTEDISSSLLPFLMNLSAGWLLFLKDTVLFWKKKKFDVGISTQTLILCKDTNIHKKGLAFK